MRVAFDPDVLILRVATGLRAARLRANAATPRSLIDSIPGAIYRCACDRDWTMEWLSDEIETMTGYPASDFIGNAVRTFASIEHPDDHGLCTSPTASWSRCGPAGRSRSSTGWSAATARSAGCWSAGSRRRRATAAGGSTARSSTSPSAARPSRRCASTPSPRRSSPRCVPRARGSWRPPTAPAATSSATSTTAPSSGSSRSRSACASGSPPTRTCPTTAARPSLQALDDLGTGLGELRDLARGLHPAVLSDHGLEHALRALAQRSTVPVELATELPGERLPMAVEAAAYFVASEALTNVARYAEASQAWVGVEERAGELEVTIRDDGRGGAGARRRIGAAGPARPRLGDERDARDREPAGRRHDAVRAAPVALKPPAPVIRGAHG